MGDLSAHFSKKELSCRCCGRLQIDSACWKDSKPCGHRPAPPYGCMPDIVALGTTVRLAEFRTANTWKVWRRT